MKKTAQGEHVRADGLMPIAPEKNFHSDTQNKQI